MVPKFAYRDIILFTAVLSLAGPFPRAQAQLTTGISTRIAIGQAATGHITTDKADKREIHSLDQKHTSRQAYDAYYRKTRATRRVPMTPGKWADSNFRNPETRRQYREAGAVSVYNPYNKKERTVSNSPSDMGPEYPDGSRILKYQHEGDFERKPFEFTLHSDLDTWKEELTPPGEREPRQAAAGFLSPDGGLYLYDLFFQPSIPLHEATHAALRKMRFEEGIDGEENKSYLQAHLSSVFNKVHATGDREAIAAVNGFVEHLTYKYVLFDVPAEELKMHGLEGLQGKALMKYLTDPRARDLGNAVGHEFFAFTRQTITYPQYDGALFRQYTEAEKEFFSNPKLSGQTPTDNAGLWAARFLTQTSKHNSVKDALGRTFGFMKLDTERSDFDKFR